MPDRGLPWQGFLLGFQVVGGYEASQRYAKCGIASFFNRRIECLLSIILVRLNPLTNKPLIESKHNVRCSSISYLYIGYEDTLFRMCSAVHCDISIQVRGMVTIARKTAEVMAVSARFLLQNCQLPHIGGKIVTPIDSRCHMS